MCYYVCECVLCLRMENTNNIIIFSIYATGNNQNRTAIQPKRATMTMMMIVILVRTKIAYQIQLCTICKK